MIQHISKLLGDYPGPANQTRCFVHTINLIAQSILKPFDTQKAKGTKEFDDVAQALEKEQEEAIDDNDKQDKEVDDGEDDARLAPIRSMLLKV